MTEEYYCDMNSHDILNTFNRTHVSNKCDNCEKLIKEKYFYVYSVPILNKFDKFDKFYKLNKLNYLFLCRQCSDAEKQKKYDKLNYIFTIKKSQ